MMKKVFVALVVLLSISNGHAQIPERAYQYRTVLRAEIQRVWGMHLPEDIFAISAGTIHQESAWNPRAESAYAKGLTQFTPATFADMRRIDPSISADIWNPQAAIRAMAVYHKRLYSNFRVPEERLNRWAFTLSAYNGGLGWVWKDQKLCVTPCNPNLWFGNVETKNSGRAAVFFKENRGYPDKIINRWVPLYRGRF